LPPLPLSSAIPSLPLFRTQPQQPLFRLEKVHENPPISQHARHQDEPAKDDMTRLEALVAVATSEEQRVQ
jgi:hypothetical protein